MSIHQESPPDRRSILAWCLYDAGNSAFGTVIITFVFSVYFARGIVGDETAGSALWSYAMAASGLGVALLSPFMGAVADHYGARKPGLLLFSALCIIATALLYLARPDPTFVNVALVCALLVVANIGFETALVFANAMLPHLAPPHMMGRISGWAWGAGYLGGLVCLVLALVFFLGLGAMQPLLPLPQENSENVRAVAPLTALWFALLTVPLVLWTKDSARTGLSLRQALRDGMREIVHTLRAVREHGNLVRFLIASALYRDGLNTLFAVGGLFAAGAFGLSYTEILIFAIGLNVTAGLGAALFAFIDDYMGSKKTIIFSLCGLIATATAILLVTDKTAFMALALVLGIFIGPAQSAGRTLAARLAPPGLTGQTYGFYALTGKAVSFFGPLFFAMATSAFDSQRAGMVTILVLWLAGMILLATVREERGS